MLGEVSRFSEVEAELPQKNKIDAIGQRLVPFDWTEDRFMEGFVSCPEEFHLIEGPFYSDELKWEDPDRARSMIEEHLIKKYSHEVLCDLKLRDGESGVDITPQDVGVGVSQIAPVLVHAFGNTGKIIAIEQPEIHIHPALQADLGDVFIESALGENKNTFLLETHSEHLILRILRRIRETAEGEMAEWPEALRKACPNGIRPEDVAVLYVQPGKEGSEVIELPVDASGEFTCEWPGGFFEERLKEFF